MTGLLVNADQLYWKTLTRLLVVLRGLGIKKGHQFMGVLIWVLAELRSFHPMV